MYLFLRAQREENFFLYCTPFCLESFLLYPFLLRKLYPFLLQKKVCVGKIGFQKSSKFQLKVNSFRKEGYNNYNNYFTPVFRDLPQRVLGEVISTPNSSRLRGRRKEDPDNKVVWEKEARLLESCQKSLCRKNWVSKIFKILT